MNIIETLIELINSDKKRLEIIDYPEKIFLLGYNFKFIENKLKNENIKDKLTFIQIIELVKEEDFYAIYLYLIKLNNHYLNILGKYSI